MPCSPSFILLQNPAGRFQGFLDLGKSAAGNPVHIAKIDNSLNQSPRLRTVFNFLNNEAGYPVCACRRLGKGKLEGL